MATENQFVNDPFLEQLPLGELDESERTVRAHLARLDCGFVLMTYLHAKANTLSTANGIAFRLRLSRDLVEQALPTLLELGLTRRLDVGLTLWGFTMDPEKRKTVERLVDLRDQWQTRVERIE